MRKSLRWFYKQPLQQPVKISRHMRVLQVSDDPGVSAHITDFTVQPLSSTVLMSAEIGSGKQSWNARNFIDMLTQSRPPPPPLPPSYCISYSAQPQRDVSLCWFDIITPSPSPLKSAALLPVCLLVTMVWIQPNMLYQHRLTCIKYETLSLGWQIFPVKTLTFTTSAKPDHCPPTRVML